MKEQIKSFEDACHALNISPALPEVGALSESEQKAIIAHYKLTVINRALNEGWKPNWNDWNEYKYYPWFQMGNNGGSPGSGFSFCGYGRGFAASSVGSRLCFKTSELAEYAGKTFEDLYRNYFLID